MKLYLFYILVIKIKKKNKNHEMNYYYKKERKIEFNLIKEIKNIL